MIREFLAKVELHFAAGQFPEPHSTKPVTSGDVVVGVLQDPWLKALVIAYYEHVDATLPKTPQELLRDLGRFPRMLSEFEALEQLVWAEIQLYFGVFRDPLCLRAEWTIVRISHEEAERLRPPAALSPEELRATEVAFFST